MEKTKTMRRGASATATHTAVMRDPRSVVTTGSHTAVMTDPRKSLKVRTDRADYGDRKARENHDRRQAPTRTVPIPAVSEALRRCLAQASMRRDAAPLNCFTVVVSARMLDAHDLGSVACAAATDLARMRGSELVAKAFVVIASPAHHGFGRPVSCEAQSLAPQELQELLAEEQGRAAASLCAIVRYPRTTLTLALADGTTWTTTERAFVGRSPSCDLVLDDRSVSGIHAQLTCNIQGTWSVVDVGSTNGTRVGTSLVSTRVLAPGDRVTLGTAPAFVVERIEAV
ncbi:MAG: FHA domain-containing protein [Coriobacteriales bacterium]|nr:FHA domain-containing protein [Coriobacteriales bacterium]